MSDGALKLSTARLRRVRLDLNGPRGHAALGVRSCR
jgi:hypothetical protein